MLHPAFFGFGLLLAWKAFVVPFAAPKVFSSSLQILVPVVAVLLWKHLHPLERRPGVLWGIGGAGTAATLLLGFASAEQPFAALPFVFELASYASSAVYTLFFLLWCELYAKLDIASAGVAVAGSYLLGSALYFGLGPLDASMLLGVGMALPLASSAMLSCGLGYLVRAAGTSASNRWRGESLASLLRSRIFPWRIIFVIGVFYFAAGVSRAVLSTSLDLLSVGCAGVLVVALVVLSPVISSGVSIYRMMGIALPVMAASLLVGVVAGDGSAVARILISVAQTVGMIVLVMFLCDSSHRFGLPVVVLVAAARIVTTVAFLVGGCASGMTLELANRTLGTELLYAVAIVAFGAATAYWLYGVNAANEFDVQESGVLRNARPSQMGAVGFDGFEAKASVRTEGMQGEESPGALTGDQASEALRAYIEQRSRALAKSYGLSPRETDVLVLLAWGKSIHAVEETLVLSANTIKTHVRHIYSKLGIHSRAELDMLLYDDSSIDAGCSGE